MGSTNKTPRLGLNDWVGSDAPMREDFCADNARLDERVGGHCADAAAHLSEGDRTLLTQAFAVGSYVGDEAATREFAVGFKPRFGVVFAADQFISEYDRDYQYTACGFGFVSRSGDSVGVHLRDGGFSVDYQEGNAARRTTPVLNRLDTRYVYVMWR